MTSISGIVHNICNHLRSGLQTHIDVLFVLLFPCLKKNVMFVLLSAVDRNDNSDELGVGLGEGVGLGVGLGEGVGLGVGLGVEFVEFIVVEFVEFVEFVVVEFVEFVVVEFVEFVEFVVVVVEFVVVEFVEFVVVVVEFAEFVEFIGDKFITESSTIGHDEVIGQDHSVTLCI